jgi:NADPH2:quinone reductase
VRAIRVHRPGGPDALVLEEVPVAEPGPGQARVRLEAIGVNFIDVYHRSGQYPMPAPFTPGQEGAGTVEALGEGVTEVRVGDRVAWAGVTGAYAETQVVPAARLVPVPAGLEAWRAAAVMLQGMTAHYLARSTFALAPGTTALVHAAAGGVGLLLCQLGRAAGARVIGTVSTPAKAALARAAGADAVIDVRQADFAAECRRLVPEGLDVVYDSVGKDTFERGLPLLRPRGLMVLYGQSSGAVPPYDLQGLNKHGSLFVTRPSLGHYTATRAELLARAADVLGAVAAGSLEVRVHATYPLADAARAHADLEGRRTAGKLLLGPG